MIGDLVKSFPDKVHSGDVEAVGRQVGAVLALSAAEVEDAGSVGESGNDLTHEVGWLCNPFGAGILFVFSFP